MATHLQDLIDVEFPLFAFSHCRDVVVAVSRAGGFGVLGGSSFTPESLEEELNWIDAHVDGKPYGIDILIPENIAVDMDRLGGERLAELVPEAHRQFAVRLLEQYGIQASVTEIVQNVLPSISGDISQKLLDVAFRHPIKLIANALGIAPKSMLERGNVHGVPVAALVGAKEHAVRQIHAGVDIIVAQGGEAGGHCGEVSTLVLVPEVIEAARTIREVPVLAAGGIVTGGQMAGLMAMGAAGAWTGSVWLSTVESEVSDTFRRKMIEASSRDTIRSSARTGKPCRQLKSAWFDAWDDPAGPGPLPMPIMGMLSQPAFEKIDRSVLAGNKAAEALVSYFVGQGVGLIQSARSAGNVVQDFKNDFIQATERLNTYVR